MMRSALILTLAVTACLPLTGQEKAFTRADTLRGALLPERRCFDVRFNDLDVRIDPSAQTVAGSNTILFGVDSAFDRMQVDLFANMTVDTITLDGGTPLRFEREGNAIHILCISMLPLGSSHRLRVAYHGAPQTSKNPPWDGGFTWRKDSAGGPWAVVTCQGTGASLWWPNKDHQSDEPDSMRIAITVPPGLEDVSNGRLRGVTAAAEGWNRYEWFVASPINNYDVTVNIGRFAHWSDYYVSGLPGDDTLALDYYVLPENLALAKEQFKDVKRMLPAFERFFGPYPFYRDGYKLVESPHNGMEHQSAVAYGNRYVNGYRGQSSSPQGLLFDFIIVHESAHEWWGNSVTSNDVADMWVHESFGAYAEALFLEFWYGEADAQRYINAKKQNVGNRTPIRGTFGVQNEGSGDMYDKGQLVLNTVRSLIDDDSTWFTILRSVQTTYRHRCTDGDSIIALMSEISRRDLRPVMRQYLDYASLPVFETRLQQKGDTLTLWYRWNADVEGFNLPVRAMISRGTYELLQPTAAWQRQTLHGITPAEFRIDDDHVLCQFRKTVNYADPRSSR